MLNILHTTEYSKYIKIEDNILYNILNDVSDDILYLSTKYVIKPLISNDKNIQIISEENEKNINSILSNIDVTSLSNKMGISIDKTTCILKSILEYIYKEGINIISYMVSLNNSLINSQDSINVRNLSYDGDYMILYDILKKFEDGDDYNEKYTNSSLIYLFKKYRDYVKVEELRMNILSLKYNQKKEYYNIMSTNYDELEFRISSLNGNIDKLRFYDLILYIYSHKIYDFTVENSKVSYYTNDNYPKGEHVRVTEYIEHNKIIKKYAEIKRRIKKYDIPFEDLNIRLSASNERKISDFDGKLVLIRHRKRYIFTKPEDHKIELTEIREVKDIREVREVKDMKDERKEKLNKDDIEFKHTNNTLDNNIHYEIEIEILKSNPDINHMLGILNYVLNNLVKNEIPVVPKKIQFSHPITPFHELGDISRFVRYEFNSLYPYKQRTDINPINLKKKDIYTLYNYSVTNKLNGVRKQLYFTNNIVYSISSNNISVLHTGLNDKLNGTILECELFKKIHYIFDMPYKEYVYQGRKPIEYRISDILDIYDILPRKLKSIIKVKRHHYKLKDDSKDTIGIKNKTAIVYNIIKNMKEEYNDGIIYTPTYMNMPTYKWKPPHMLTIDFLAVKKGDEYILSVFDMNTGKNVPFVGSKKYPYRHTTIIDEKNMEYIVDGEVSEFEYDHKNNVFIPIRIRYDKNGKSNRLDVALDVWEDINDPITYEYLIKHLPQDIHIMNKNHNIIKNEMIRILATGKTVLDIGSGKGGDLMKYYNNYVTKLYMIEPNEKNVYELKRRLNDNYSIDHHNFKTKIILEKGENYDRLSKILSREREKFDVLSMFFSLTFFFETENKLRSLVNVIDFFLKDGGYFIGTVMDGEKVALALQNIDEIKTNEYVITKKYDKIELNNIGYGKKIYIQMYNSRTLNGQYEYLVDMKELMRLLKEKHIYSCGIDVFEQSKKYTKETRFFSSLNKTFVFQKN